MCYNPPSMLIDTHAHLTMPEFAPDLPQVLERAAAAGVATILCVGVDLPSSDEAVVLAQQLPMLRATVGVHPNDSEALPEAWIDQLRALARDPVVVALGEIGLDYYRERTDPERQRAVFRAQLDLAGELNLPVVVHNREASEDVAEILQEWSRSLPAEHPRGVLHCFSGDRALLDRSCAAGFCVSFAGPITYSNGKLAAEMAAAAPADCLLLETDSPYLAPHPHRGKRNEPALVRVTAERMAALRGVSLETIVETTGRNAARLFGLATTPNPNS